jgi:hypothetical protein
MGDFAAGQYGRWLEDRFPVRNRRLHDRQISVSLQLPRAAWIMSRVNHFSAAGSVLSKRTNPTGCLYKSLRPAIEIPPLGVC